MFMDMALMVETQVGDNSSNTDTVPDPNLKTDLPSDSVVHAYLEFINVYCASCFNNTLLNSQC